MNIVRIIEEEFRFVISGIP